MPSRAELELRAASANIVAAAYLNDSVLEQKVITAEKTRVASGTATVLTPSTNTVSAVSGGA